LFQLPNGEAIQFILMRQQIARFRDERRIAIESGVCFARCCRRGVMCVGYIRGRLPLRLAVDAIEGLVTGVGEF
jgi:hypothetical protein